MPSHTQAQPLTNTTKQGHCKHRWWICTTTHSPHICSATRVHLHIPITVSLHHSSDTQWIHTSSTSYQHHQTGSYVTGKQHMSWICTTTHAIANICSTTCTLHLICAHHQGTQWWAIYIHIMMELASLLYICPNCSGINNLWISIGIKIKQGIFKSAPLARWDWN